jgi:hypothetical protein
VPITHPGFLEAAARCGIASHTAEAMWEELKRTPVPAPGAAGRDAEPIAPAGHLSGSVTESWFLAAAARCGIASERAEAIWAELRKPAPSEKPSPIDRRQRLSHHLETWQGTGVATIVAGCGGTLASGLLVIGILLVMNWTNGDAQHAMGRYQALLSGLFLTVPLVACAGVGFVCGRWWAFTGAVCLAPLLVFGWLFEGNPETILLMLACPAAALGVGPMLRWAYEQRRSSSA